MRKKLQPYNGICILPTDTLYGLCTSALDKNAIEKIYEMKGRDDTKPFIILISNIKDLETFGVSLSLIRKHRQLLDTLWPGKVSIIFPLKQIAQQKYRYLHRGTGTLAFRVPKKKSLVAFLKTSGPLVAPSANLQGKKPAETISEAKKYFGNDVDHYIGGGRLRGSPSSIVEIANDGTVNLVREGCVKLPLSVRID
ncbi:MAG: threonylcarbamoyl-AMP synthase [Candidatus Pacebacteria bacterium]|nr:threonylcarbamoyl-AMP synthase [Candidatus Paceibacterota bacterium]